MLLIKSFLRKSTTKNYLKIYTLIIISILLLVLASFILKEKENEGFKGTYIELSTNDASKLETVDNILEVRETIAIEYQKYNEYLLLYDNDLVANEIIIHSTYQDIYDLDDTINLEDNEFILKGYHNEKNLYNFYYVSLKYYEELKNTNPNKYIIILKNNLKRETTLKEIENLYNDDEILLHSYMNNNTSYNDFIVVINILLITLIIIFGIVLIMSSFNIIQDEKKKNIIYYRIGYSKNKLRLYNLFKISLVLIISLIIATIIFLIISLLVYFLHSKFTIFSYHTRVHQLFISKEFIA